MALIRLMLLPLCLVALSTLAMAASGADPPSTSEIYLHPSVGLYATDIQVGTPPQKVTMLLDTSATLSWMKCAGARSTHFDNRQSRTLKTMSCTDPDCKMVKHPKNFVCDKNQRFVTRTCDFMNPYTQGTTVMDTFSVGNRKFTSTFGCASEVNAPVLEKVTGILTLGRVPFALPSQAGVQRLSYCLQDFSGDNGLQNKKGKLVLGGLSPPNLQYIPLIGTPDSGYDYYVDVEGVSIAGRKVEGLDAKVWAFDKQGGGGTHFHIGTTLTMLREPAYTAITTALRKLIPLSTVNAPPLQFCYSAKNLESAYKVLPMLTITFAGGVQMQVPPQNYMVNQEPNVLCIAMQPTQDDSAPNVFGALLQRNFNMEMQAQKMAFTWGPC